MIASDHPQYNAACSSQIQEQQGDGYGNFSDSEIAEAEDDQTSIYSDTEQPSYSSSPTQSLTKRPSHSFYQSDEYEATQVLTAAPEAEEDEDDDDNNILLFIERTRLKLSLGLNSFSHIYNVLLRNFAALPKKSCARVIHLLTRTLRPIKYINATEIEELEYMVKKKDKWFGKEWGKLSSFQK